jgi:hypothetical protein
MLIGDRLSEQDGLFRSLCLVGERVRVNDMAGAMQFATWFLADLASCMYYGFRHDDPWYILYKAIVSASYGYVAKRNRAAIDGRRYMGQVIDAALRASAMFDELGEVYRG